MCLPRYTTVREELIVSIYFGIYLLFRKSRSPYLGIGLGFGIAIVHTIVDGKLVFIKKIA